MRTTISLDGSVLRTAKRRAQQLGLTLGQLIEAALRRELSRAEQPSDRPVVPIFEGTGLRPGVDATSVRELLEVIDSDIPIDKLR